MRIKQVPAETHKGFKRYQTPFGKPLKTARGFYLPNYWTQKRSLRRNCMTVKCLFISCIIIIQWHECKLVTV